MKHADITAKVSVELEDGEAMPTGADAWDILRDAIDADLASLHVQVVPVPARPVAVWKARARRWAMSETR